MITREPRDDGEVDWLLKKHGRVQSLRCVPVVIVGKRSEYDHWCVWMHQACGREYLQATVAISTQTQIGDDQVKRKLTEKCGFGFGQCRGGDHRHVIRGEEVDERLPDGDLVFDDQDTMRHGAIRARVDDRSFGGGEGCRLIRRITAEARWSRPSQTRRDFRSRSCRRDPQQYADRARDRYRCRRS